MSDTGQAFDWAAMIEQLLTLGMSERGIGRVMQSELTRRMIEAYRRGAQPLHWRGELLVRLWCTETKKDRAAAPRCDVVRGHRVDRRHIITGPQIQSLPQWPVAAPVPAAPALRKKPGPKPKVRVEA